MNGNITITIEREYGSGGREIGQKLAQCLGVKFYDNELIAMAAKESGMSEEAFEKVDETSTNSLLYSIVTGTYLYGAHLSSPFELPLNDKLFIIQSNVIKSIAAKESAVIVGRCAEYILRDDPESIHVFIHADKEKRIERAQKLYHIPSGEAATRVHKKDKQRATYYNYYTGEKWGMADHYHLTLDSGSLGIEGCVKVIEAFVNNLKNKMEAV